MTKRSLLLLLLCMPTLARVDAAGANEWQHWRGPAGDGTTAEINLVSNWSPAGENLVWRRDFTGRSTPVVFGGRVCANGRVGEGIQRQEMVACFDAGSGEKLWEFRFNVYQTTVPWNRVGWANVTGDPATGYLYVQGVGGLFFCLDSRDGRIVWQHNFIEEYGFMEGYGGRTQTPTIDDERVYITFANTSWGDQARPLHRVWAFDKQTGEPLWTSAPASSMADKNSQSTPAVATINGQRLVIMGLGDGGIYALQARTGEKIWEFHLSKRAINTSVLVHDNVVYAAHSEENVDDPSMGRVVAIDATGTGDVTSTHELWRAPLGVGFASPAFQDGILYVIDNSANLHALESATGKTLWEHSLGTVGKGSPALADGKLFATEVNGHFHILAVSKEGAEVLDTERIAFPGRSYAEIYGSPAIAYGRVYFTTEEGIYCLGDPERSFAAEIGEAAVWQEESASGEPARLRVMPADVELRPGESSRFRAEAFDAKGRSLGTREVAWQLEGLRASMDGDQLTVPGETTAHAGRLVASFGDLKAAARVRVVPPPPFAEDFETAETGGRPSYFLAYVGAFQVQELDGNKVLYKGPAERKVDRHITFLGSHRDNGYTVEADVMGTQEGRRRSDLGLINSGYTLDLMGNHQRLEIRSWASALRMVQRADFAWEQGVWYRMKLRVDIAGDSAIIKGRVWKRGEEEPDTWQITAEDPLPIEMGSPGLYGYTPTPVYFDNIAVSRNEP